ncbi:MAG: TIGR02253 family HAD-type hydrolase [Euryarchaeota archaeon]|nr:TIGR02253 family HAD-type hydrolase [Euryarchaeota archaeon]
MLKAVFFDIDDTLYDSTTLARRARLNSIRAMIDAGLEERDEARLYSLLQRIIKKFGSNYPRHYDELLNELGVPWNPKIVAAGVVAYEHTKFGYLKPFPGVVPTLIELRQRFRLGVISNGLAIKQWEKLINLSLHHFFDVVVTSEEVGCEKPSRRIFEVAVRRLGVASEECVMVGDRIATDVVGGKRAGMRTVWVRRGKYASSEPRSEEERPDAIIREIVELPEVLEKLSR